MGKRSTVQSVTTDDFLEKYFDALRTRTIDIGAGVQGTVVDIVIEQARRTRRPAGYQSRKARHRVLEAGRIGVGVIHTMARQLGNTGAGIGTNAFWKM